MYVQVVADVFCSLAFAKVYTSKMPMTACDLLYDRVLPVYEALGVPIAAILTDNGLSARGWSGAETQHPSGGSGSRCPVRPRRTQPAQWSSASEKDPAAHSEHRVRARAGPALTVLNTA